MRWNTARTLAGFTFVLVNCLSHAATYGPAVPEGAPRTYKAPITVVAAGDATDSEEKARRSLDYVIAMLPALGGHVTGRLLGQSEVLERRDQPCRIVDRLHLCSATLKEREFGPTVRHEDDPGAWARWSGVDRYAPLPESLRPRIAAPSIAAARRSGQPGSQAEIQALTDRLDQLDREAAAPAGNPAALLAMTEQLDRLDRLDLEGAVEAAEKCTRRRDYGCAEREVARADRLVNGQADRNLVQLARRGIQEEREAERQEERIQKEMEDFERQQRRAEAEARREERDADSGGGLNIGAAILAGMNDAMKDRHVIQGIHNRMVANVNRMAEQQQAAAREAAAAKLEALRRERAETQAANLRSRQEFAAARAQEQARLRQAQLAEREQLLRQEQERRQAQPREVARPPAPVSASPPPEAQRPRTVVLADAAASASQRETVASNKAPTERRSEWGEIQMESMAICVQKKSDTTKWKCHGAFDNDQLLDQGLEPSLKRQHCNAPERMPMGVQYDGDRWETFRCGHGLLTSDNDLGKRFNLAAIQRRFICRKDAKIMERCDTLYSGQDKR